ncbi:hypothetical protein DMENIID0001_136380 [Sergentomyia squamirostris]
MPKNRPEMNVFWRSHFESLGAVFPEMLTRRKFVDVTLVCEGRRIHCHRVVLAASSSYFSDLFEENPAQHPIVILPRDVKFWAIQALVEFMYKGEVSVSENGFEELVKCAGMLHIRGFNKAITSHFLKNSGNSQNSLATPADDQEDDIDDPLDFDMDDVINNFKIEAIEVPDGAETLPILLPTVPAEEENNDLDSLPKPKPTSSKRKSARISERKVRPRVEEPEESQEIIESLNPDDSDIEEASLTKQSKEKAKNQRPGRNSDNDDSMNVDDGENHEYAEVEGTSNDLNKTNQSSKSSWNYFMKFDTPNSAKMPNMDVITVQAMKEHFTSDLGERILDSGVSDEKTRSIVHSAHRFMLQHFGLYPSTATKRAIAECTVEIFPELNVEVLFDKTKGLLETRCRYFQRRAMRKGEGGKMKKRKEKESKMDAASVKKAEENIEFLQNASLKYQKERIVEAFRENFRHRQHNLSSVFQDYDRVFHLCPALLIQDFETKFGSTETAMEIYNSMDIEWQYSMQKPSANKQKVDFAINTWCPSVARTLKFLSLFPPLNVDKTCKKSTVLNSVTKFIMFFREGSSPARIKAEIDEETSNPQLFAVGPDRKTVSRYYVKIEDKIFPATTDFHASLDFYLKVHYSLNLKPEYPVFCRFMAKYVYKIDKDPLTSGTLTKIASEFKLL